MRMWQVERRKRTPHLIELGGLVVKAGIVDLVRDDRATILGALLWIADKLKGDRGEHARALWLMNYQVLHIRRMYTAIASHVFEAAISLSKRRYRGVRLYVATDE